MNTKLIVGSAASALLFITGCDSMSHTENGALAGGGIGAVTGALVGGATGHAGVGAAIGGGVGALAGAAIGHSEDKAEQRAIAQAQARYLGLADIAQMTQQHISDAVIINQIRATGSAYNLSANDIYWLKSQGVSDAVVAEMQATAYRYPQAVYVADPAPVAVGVGVGVRVR